MPIPTAFNGNLADVDNAASNIMTQLNVMHRAAEKDLPRLRERLLNSLVAYVALVMSTAPGGK